MEASAASAAGVADRLPPAESEAGAAPADDRPVHQSSDTKSAAGQVGSMTQKAVSQRPRRNTKAVGLFLIVVGVLIIVLARAIPMLYKRLQ